MTDYTANWYTIPGFTAYEINVHDRRVRSNKHFNKQSHHIMKVYDDDKVRIVDDFGKPKRVTVDDLYELTFNSGHKLNPRGDYYVYKGGMIKGLRNSIPEVVESEKYIELDFYNALKGSANQLIKPFTINLDRN